MAENLKLILEVDTKNSTNSLIGLEERLSVLKERIKLVEVGSAGFKALQSEIRKSESEVKNLNKSFEGLDTEAMAGEFGKFAGGITAGFTAIAAVGGKSMEEVVKTVSQGMAVMQGIQGATEAWTSAQNLLNGVLSMNPIGLIVTAIRALIVIIAIVIAKGDGIKKMLTEWGEKFTFLKGPIDVIKKGIDLLMDSWNKLSQAVSWAMKSDEDAQKNIDKMRADFKKREEQRHNAEIDRLYEKKKKENEHTKALKDQQDKRIADAKAKQDKIDALNKEAVDRETQLQKEAADREKGYYELSLQAAKGNAELIEQLKQEQWDKELAIIDARGVMSEDDALKYKQILQDKADSNQAYLDLITEQELLKAEKDAENAQVLKEAQDEAEQARIDNIDLENERLIAQYDFEKGIIDQQIEDLNKKGVLTEEEQAKYDKLLQERIKLDKKYTKDKKALDNILTESQKQQWEAAAGYLGMAASLFEENTAAFKLLASAQIIISTAMGAMKAFAEFGNPIIGGIMAGIVVAAGAVQIVKVNGVQFADGGILNGPSHAQGGILTPFGEVEGGEGIINARSMSNVSLRNMASAANVAGGGRNFSTGDGTISLSPESIAMLNDKKVYVTESDITTAQNKVKIYESNATY